MSVAADPHNHSLLPPAASFGWIVEAAAAERLRYAAMKRNILTAVLALMLGAKTALAADGVIPIVDDPKSVSEKELTAGHRPSTKVCSKQAPKTMFTALFPEAQQVNIHQFDARDWRNFDSVKNYVMRLLRARPEGDKLASNVYWAEGRGLRVYASIEFSNGKHSPLWLDNGYVHFKDAEGCDWWGRYLGWDKKRWVVRP